jgi:hypothetical protein
VYKVKYFILYGYISVYTFTLLHKNKYSREGKWFTDFNDLATNSSLGIDGIKRQVGTVVDSIAKKAENRSQQQAPEQQNDRVVYRGR